MNIIHFIHIPKNSGTSIKEITNNNKIIKYCGHNTDIYNKKITNQLVIIRNPIERFISAVYYCLQKWSHEPQIRYLIQNNIDTPEKWVQIWMNPNHKEYPKLIQELQNKNTNHTIGKTKLLYKYTYTPQKYWFHTPKYIIIMDNLQKEFNYFTKKYNIRGKLPIRNKTIHKNSFLSESSKQFLQEFYKDDFILYNTYKNIDYKKRI